MDAYILAAKRTAIGRSHAEVGAFRNVRADVMLSELIKDLLRIKGVGPSTEDILVGCVGQHLEQGKNIARLAGLLGGLPVETAGVTINRLCGSSLQAFAYAAMALESRQNEVVMAGGVEHMQHVPMQAALDYNPMLLAQYEFPFTQMGLTAERVAELYDISRTAQDEYALLSHKRALQAQKNGHFNAEILPVATPEGIFAIDQGPRADSSPESLAKLKTIFKENGTVTAGNSCAVSDGASLCLLASRAGAQRLGLKARARVEAVTVVGLDPLTMGLGPIPAIKKILHKMKMNVGDIDRFEINEAFASQVLACLRDLGIPLEKVNNNGGAIALGHPLGCTGTRLITTLLHELERSKKEVGIAALCVGHGQGMAVMIKRVAGEF